MKEYKAVPMRDGYGNALLKLCAADPKVMVLDADVAKSTRTDWIKKEYPDHFLDMGISEQDMVGTASGMALGGLIPFCSTYGVFLAGRAWDQIRTTVCYNNLNVKLGGAHAGLSVGRDGATHQALEDVAIMRVLPNMTVVVPCDSLETEKATLAAAAYPGPVYLRFGREAVPVITDEDTEFEIGRARHVSGPELRNAGEIADAAIFANGPMVREAAIAAEKLAAEGITAAVYDLHTVKPLDEEALLAAAESAKVIVTAEEHQLAGGMGGAVSEFLSVRHPVLMRMIGVDDSFGESGSPDQLYDKYGLRAENIAAAARGALGR
ncbi:MAG: transketolase family protein [Lachnospiraceae bacterium]|nr:transketolase family protein [Lachnospiraceae bacterium]